MYTSYNRDQDHLNIPEVSTKYTDYLKAFDDNFHLDQGKGGRQQRQSNNHYRHRGSHPLQILSDNEVKFSNIFSPNESNAIKLQLIQKSSSLPVLDPDSNNNYSSALISDTNSNGADESEALQSRRRSTASGTLHANANSNVVRKGESVTNILYSTIRHGPEYENPSADETLHTGSDSKVDYDPHEPLPAVDQIALRHELLNNIRAISRATYFEDLYTGKIRENSGSPEGELLRLLGNPQQVKTDKSGNVKTIPSKETNLSRVDRWVKESSEASSGTQQTDTDEEKDRTPSAKHTKTSLFHQSMWKEDHKKGKKDQINKKEKTKSIKGKGKPNDGTGTENSYTTESDLETASAYLRKSKNNIALGKIGEDKTKKVTHGKNYYPNGIIESSSQYLQSKYLGNPVDGQFELHGKKRPFSFGLNSTSNDAPLSVSLPNVAHNNSYRSTPAIMHDTISIKSYSTSRPENLNYSGTNFPSKPTYGKLKKRDLKSNDRGGGEQVRNMIPHKPAIRVDNRHVGDGASNSKHNAGGSRQLKPDRKVPGIYARLNLNQWVMKKVWFYVNGDDLYPRFEYRFRQGKDIRDMDQLLDLLTKRFPTLPTGARFVFTTDGYPINSLDEIVNENSYIVSSTRKFKAIKYGNGDNDVSNTTSGNGKRDRASHRKNVRNHQPLHKQLSTSDGYLNSNRDELHFQKPSVHSKLSKKNSKSVSDVPKLVAHVIEEAASTSPTNSSYRQPIRVINGINLSLQSQVLLNTRTSQPFEDLVRDLAMSVKIPNHPVGNSLQTLAGRQIRSYSQLRSELKAGQRTFYVSITTYGNDLRLSSSDRSIYDKHAIKTRKNRPGTKTILGKVNSNSSSDISISPENHIHRKPTFNRMSHLKPAMPYFKSP